MRAMWAEATAPIIMVYRRRGYNRDAVASAEGATRSEGFDISEFSTTTNDAAQ